MLLNHLPMELSTNLSSTVVRVGFKKIEMANSEKKEKWIENVLTSFNFRIKNISSRHNKINPI